MITFQRSKQLPLLVIAMSLVFSAQTVKAGMISTEQVLSAEKIRADREKVQSFMNRADVEKQLQTLGVPAEAAKSRVDALTDSEVETVAGKIDLLPAGGALSQTDIILILLIAILVAIAI